MPGSALGGSGATKAAASGGGSTVWSSGLCRPDTSLASILLHAMPAEVRHPASTCRHHHRHYVMGVSVFLSMYGGKLGKHEVLQPCFCWQDRA